MRGGEHQREPTQSSLTRDKFSDCFYIQSVMIIIMPFECVFGLIYTFTDFINKSLTPAFDFLNVCWSGWVCGLDIKYTEFNGENYFQGNPYEQEAIKDTQRRSHLSLNFFASLFCSPVLRTIRGDSVSTATINDTENDLQLCPYESLSARHDTTCD